MNVRIPLVCAAALAATATGFHHSLARRTRARLEAERIRAVAAAAESRRMLDATNHRIESARRELEATKRARAENAMAARAAPPRGAAAKPASAPATPELRQLQIQVFVSEQRQRFAALLNRLGFRPEQRQAFDAIQAAYQRAVLDESLRPAAKQTRDTQLKELFGPAFDEWTEFNRTEPARLVVAQIVQQTFQSRGALTTAQADELTRIVDRHRSPATTEPAARYNWDRIVEDARAILADQQIDPFLVAIQYRRASEKMSAIAAARK